LLYLALALMVGVTGWPGAAKERVSMGQTAGQMAHRRDEMIGS